MRGINTARSIIVILAFLALIILHGRVVKQHAYPRRKDIVYEQLTDKQLKRWYSFYNRTLFDSNLPGDTRVTFSDLTEELGDTSTDADAVRHIRIDRQTNPVPRQAQLTLIHEQCHIKTEGQELDPHGPKFEACMLSVATLGGFKGLW